jgi:hypothetical protein
MKIYREGQGGKTICVACAVNNLFQIFLSFSMAVSLMKKQDPMEVPFPE